MLVKSTSGVKNQNKDKLSEFQLTYFLSLLNRTFENQSFAHTPPNLLHFLTEKTLLKMRHTALQESILLKMFFFMRIQKLF